MTTDTKLEAVSGTVKCCVHRDGVKPYNAVVVSFPSGTPVTVHPDTPEYVAAMREKVAAILLIDGLWPKYVVERKAQDILTTLGITPKGDNSGT